MGRQDQDVCRVQTRPFDKRAVEIPEGPHVRTIPLVAAIELLWSCAYSIDHYSLATFRLRKVMGAYTDDRPYSLDLVSAVSTPFTNLRLRTSLVLEIGATTGNIYRKDA
jgi:hypothetical protein